MDPVQVLAVLRAAAAALDAAQAVGANVSELTARIQEARAEGRDLTDDELQAFADDAQEAIDRLRG